MCFFGVIMKYVFLLFFITITIFAIDKKDVPLLFLNGNSESFFVLGSDIRFNVEMLKKENWVDVDKLKDKNIFQTAVTLYGKKTDDSNKIKYNAIKINFTDDKNNSDFVLIPVVMADNSYSDEYLIKNIPADLIKLNTNLKNIEVNKLFTPGGNFIFEIINTENQFKFFNKTANKEASQLYEIVFPWMCLEYCSASRTATVEHAEVHNHLDTVNAVSYERYTMNGGTWQILSVTNPTTLILNDGLEAYPMINARTRDASFDEAYITNYINQIWNNKETLATQMVNEAVTNNYAGYCLDVETQKVVPDTQTRYIQLVDFFAKKLHEANKKLIVAHATWSTIAPMNRLSDETEVDYVATMDPYTKSTLFFERNGDETQGQAYKDYHAISPERLIWGFAWEYHDATSQANQFDWLETKGYNNNVAGAAIWRTPAESTNGINYYEAMGRYYPISRCDNMNCGEHGSCDDTSGQAHCNCEMGYIEQNYTCTENINGTWIENIIDVKSNQFEINGPIPFWNTENIGQSNKSNWCYTNNSEIENSGKWNLTINEAKEYQIYVYIPEIANKSANVNYIVYHNGIKDEITVNQSQINNDWYYLGNFYFVSGSGQFIQLDDKTTESQNSMKKVIFNSIKTKTFQAN